MVFLWKTIDEGPFAYHSNELDCRKVQMEMPNLSVIIPTYNRANMVGRAISSALSQTEQAIEVIVVDDCSTDATRDQLSAWQRRDSRVRPVLQAANQGPAGARNRGVAEARGEFVAFLDSDDVWRRGHLESGVRFLAARPDLDVVFADIQRIGVDGVALEESLLWERRDIGRYLKPVSDAKSSGWLTFRVPEVQVLLREYIVPIQTMIIRREVAAACPFDPSLRIAEDYDFTLRVARSGSRFGFVHQVQCEWMIHDDNLISNGRSGLSYGEEQGKLWLKMLKDRTITATERRLLNRRIAKWRFDEGYTHFRKGRRRDARQCYLKSLLTQFSWRAAKGMITAFVVPHWCINARQAWVDDAKCGRRTLSGANNAG
jgi:glycosyltransferase involved in cell wall biosynthesis